jgi:hypothetical protein
MISMRGVSARRVRIEVWECRCEICGHRWRTEGDSLPRRCNNHQCRSTLWNLARKSTRRRPPQPEGGTDA